MALEADGGTARSRLVDAMTQIDTINAVEGYAVAFPHARGYRVVSGVVPDITTRSGEPYRSADIVGTALGRSRFAALRPRAAEICELASLTRDEFCAGASS
jgi:hypothetical protein